MAIKFNDFGKNYGNYNFLIGQEASKKTQETEETKDTAKTGAVFKGLENETDLLTKNPQSVYGLQFAKFSSEDKEIADTTNEILASMGYKYKVSPAQVASVANSVNVIITPGMKLAEDDAVEAHIQNPNGPFADIFTKG